MIILQSADAVQQAADYSALSPDQQVAVDTIMADIHRRSKGTFFLTGPAGSGKSFVIRYLSKYADATVTATTGIAAQLVGGRTIHAVTGWRPYSQVPDYDMQLQVLGFTQLVIIDEISMLDARFFQAFHENRDQGENPYTILLVGDFLQLPPVNKPQEEKLPCFKAKAWKAAQRIILTTQHRQSDPEFIAALGDIRIGRVTPRVRALIQERSAVAAPEGIPFITPRNDVASNENGRRMMQLPGDGFYAHATIQSEKNLDDEAKERLFKNRARVLPKLWLKVGARVIFLMNKHPDWYNGSLGTVLELPRTFGGPVTVQLDTGETARVDLEAEEVHDAYGEVETTIMQYPLKLAYGLSVHKSQGQTLEKALIDLNCRYFAPGQKYVALSRVKTKAGLYLKGGNLDLIVDPECLRESGVEL